MAWWRNALQQLMHLGAIGLAGLLLLADLALGATWPALITGVIVAVLALMTSDLQRRVVGSVLVSASGILAAPLMRDAISFGLTEAAGLGLLLVMATRYLAARAAVWAVPALSAVVLLLPSRLGADQAGLVLVLAVCVLMAIALGGLLRAQDHDRAGALARVRSDERLSLARDLHDSVAHHVTGIVVRAQAAQVVAADQPDQAIAALAAIEHEGLATLTSMRRLVGVLRDDDAERRPPAGLTQIRDLVARFSGGEPDATLSASPAAAGADIPDEVGATLHRVVQEALTNVRRHSVRPRSVRVEIDVVDGVLHVRVSDDGQPMRTGASKTGGFGLVGLEERVSALGGQLTAGPSGAHGWRVAAAVPLAAGKGLAPPPPSGPRVARVRASASEPAGGDLP
jgi:signal transduction histidine kinase